MLRIKNAKNMDDLRECKADIDYDIWEDMEWTQVKKDLNRVSNYLECKIKSMSEGNNGR